MWLVGGFDFHDGTAGNSFGRRCKLVGIEPGAFLLTDLKSKSPVRSACIVTAADVQEDLKTFKSRPLKEELQAAYLGRLTLETQDLEKLLGGVVKPKKLRQDEVAAVALPRWDISPSTLAKAAHERYGQEVEVSAPHWVDGRSVRVVVTQQGASFAAEYLFKEGRFA